MLIMKETPDDGPPVQNRPLCAVVASLVPLAPKIVRMLRKGRVVFVQMLLERDIAPVPLPLLQHAGWSSGAGGCKPR